MSLKTLAEAREENLRCLMFGWRWIHALNLIINDRSNPFARREILEELAGILYPNHAYCDEVARDVIDLVKAHSATIRYEHWGNTTKWKEFNFRDGATKLNTHKGIPLEDYGRSMLELKNTTTFNIDKMRGLLKGRSVLDFGCGFFSMLNHFRDAKVKSYCGIDRPDVFQRYFFVKDGITHSQQVLNGCIRTYLGKRFDGMFDEFHAESIPTNDGLISFCKRHVCDVIWLSEVIHGKDFVDNVVLLTILKQTLLPGGKIVIVEPKPGSPDGILFGIKMLVHCGIQNGLVTSISVEEIADRVGLKFMVTLDTISPTYDLHVLKDVNDG